MNYKYKYLVITSYEQFVVEADGWYSAVSQAVYDASDSSIISIIRINDEDIYIK